MDNQLKKNPAWKTALLMIMNPGEAVKDRMSQLAWPYALLVSGTAFTFFFMQTGIDLYRTGNVGLSSVIIISMLGLIYGTLGIAMLASLSWLLSQAGQRNIPLEWAISSFSLGYSATLIYAVIGLLFSMIFGWRTSIAFGVTGVLWALRPNMATIKQMSGDKTGFSIALTTMCGIIILFAWALLGKFQR